MFTLLKKASIEYLHAPVFGGCDFLVHAFCTRRGGVSEDDFRSLNMSFREGDEEFRVLQNWNRVAGVFDIPVGNFLVLNQVHGDGILVIEPHGEYFRSRETLNYDAVVTNRADLAVCIKTADCVPVFFVDRVKKVIGAVHAGWRGTALAISAKVIRLMQNRYGSQPVDILAAIGPSIGRCCYEVDRIVAGTFQSLKNSEDFLFPGKRKERWMLDLAAANRSQILDCGVPAASIEESGFCTVCCGDAFFSHRASGGITGRQINFMMIRGEAPCLALAADEYLRSVQ
jgi:polyphenol oxidase